MGYYDVQQCGGTTAYLVTGSSDVLLNVSPCAHTLCLVSGGWISLQFGHQQLAPSQSHLTDTKTRVRDVHQWSDQMNNEVNPRWNDGVRYLNFVSVHLSVSTVYSFTSTGRCTTMG